MNEPCLDTFAGIGFRQEAEPEDIMGLVWIAFDLAGLARIRLRALVTSQDRAERPAFRAAAAELRVFGLGLDAAALRAVDRRVPTRSPRIEASHGVGSLAEAAALAASGDGGRLVLARIKSANGRVTCALTLAPKPL